MQEFEFLVDKPGFVRYRENAQADFKELYLLKSGINLQTICVGSQQPFISISKLQTYLYQKYDYNSTGNRY
jgi:hypothetical protein